MAHFNEKEAKNVINSMINDLEKSLDLSPSAQRTALMGIKELLNGKTPKSISTLLPIMQEKIEDVFNRNFNHKYKIDMRNLLKEEIKTQLTKVIAELPAEMSLSQIKKLKGKSKNPIPEHLPPKAGEQELMAYKSEAGPSTISVTGTLDTHAENHEHVEQQAQKTESEANDGKQVDSIQANVPQDVQNYISTQTDAEKPKDNSVLSSILENTKKLTEGSVPPFKVPGFGPPGTPLDAIKTDVETIKDVQLRTRAGQKLLFEKFEKMAEIYEYISALQPKFPASFVRAGKADIEEQTKDQLSTTENQRTWLEYKQQMYGKLGKKFI